MAVGSYKLYRAKATVLGHFGPLSLVISETPVKDAIIKGKNMAFLGGGYED